MSVIIFVLKLIGIILLILLGLVLLITASLLLIPVRYQAVGKAVEEFTEFESRIKITWLFSLIRFKGIYENKEFSLVLRILGIPIRLDNETEHKKKPKKRKTKRFKETKNRKKDTITDNPIEAVEKPETTAETTEPIDALNAPKEEQNIKQESSAAGKKRRKKKTRKGWKNPVNKLKDSFHNIKSMIKDETNKSALVLFWKELRYMLHHFKPRKIKAEITFSAGDPSLTGQLLGGLSIMPFFYRYPVKLNPDFLADNIYAKGFFDVRGRVRAVHFLVFGFRLIKDKNIRKLVQQFRA